MARWVIRLIELANSNAGVPLPAGVVAHSTRGMVASWALFKGPYLEEICTVNGWTSSLTLARFYRMNVASSVIASVLQAVEHP